MPAAAVVAAESVSRFPGTAAGGGELDADRGRKRPVPAERTAKTNLTTRIIDVLTVNVEQRSTRTGPDVRGEPRAGMLCYRWRDRRDAASSCKAKITKPSTNIPPISQSNAMVGAK